MPFLFYKKSCMSFKGLCAWWRKIVNQYHPMFPYLQDIEFFFFKYLFHNNARASCIAGLYQQEFFLIYYVQNQRDLGI